MCHMLMSFFLFYDKNDETSQILIKMNLYNACRFSEITLSETRNIFVKISVNE